MNNIIQSKGLLERNYPISKIDYISLTGDEVVIGLTGDDQEIPISHLDSVKTKAFYRECLKKIEAYYEAMKPMKLSKDFEIIFNNPKIKVAENQHNDIQRIKDLGNMVDQLSAFIFELCERIKPGYAASHSLEEARDFLERFIIDSKVRPI